MTDLLYCWNSLYLLPLFLPDTLYCWNSLLLCICCCSFCQIPCIAGTVCYSVFVAVHFARYPVLLEQSVSFAVLFARYPVLLEQSVSFAVLFAKSPVLLEQSASFAVLFARAPVVLGQAVMSGEDMYMSSMRGKGVHPLHIMGDQLW